MAKVRQFVTRPNIKAFLIIFVVLASIYVAPVLTGRSQNPLLQRSGLAVGVQNPAVSGQSTIDPNDGFTSQALGHAAAESWLHGHLPYWNHNEGVGMPLAAGMQSAAFFPLTLLLSVGKGFVVFHFLLQLIAGFATYLLLKRLKLRFLLAVLGGILFSLNGTFAWLTNAAFNPVAFLPLLLLGIEFAFDRSENQKRGGWVLMAVALSLSLYSGFPETAFISALFAYGWALMRLFNLPGKYRRAFIQKIIAGGVTGLLLTAPILVAFVGYLPYALTGGHANASYANSGLPATTLPALFMPYIFGPIFGLLHTGKPVNLFLFWSNVGGYLTVPLALMAAFGLFAKRQLNLRLYLLIFVVVIVLKNFAFRPVLVLVNLLPGMSQIAFYRYSIPALSMAVIILAMFGLDAFSKADIHKRKAITITGFVTGLTLLLALYSRTLLHQLADFPTHKYWALLSLLWALSICVVFILTYFRGWIRLITITILLLVDSVVMFAIPLLSLPKIASVDYGPVTYLQQNLGLGRFYTLHPIEPNYGSYFNTASININDLPVPKNWAEYIPKNLDDNATALLFTGDVSVDHNGPTPIQEFGQREAAYEEVGVKYLVTNPGQLDQSFIDAHQLQRVYKGSNAEIYALPNTKPYFETTASCTFGDQTKDNATITCPEATQLLRRELFMPGWTATVNGKPVSVENKHDIFQSVAVPTGKSTVKFTYEPPHIKLGYAAFALGIVIIASSYITYLPPVRKSKVGAYGLRFLRMVKLK